MRLRSIILTLLALPILAGIAFLLLFDGTVLAPRLQQAVLAQTGRALTIDGRIGLVAGFTPKLTLEKVGLANIPGGTRPAMLTAEKVEIELALWPLLRRRLEITQLSVQGPDLVLERDAEGRPNWRFEKPARPPGPAPATPAEPPAPLSLAVRNVAIRDARAAWVDLNPHTVSNGTLDISGEGPTAWKGGATLDGLPISITGETAPLGALGRGAPWSVQARLDAARGRLSFIGALQGGRPEGALVLALPELESLGPVFPGRRLPALRAIEVSGRVSPAGAEALQIKLGDSTLDALWPGLRVLGASLAQSAPGQPLVLSAEATRNGQPFGLTGEAGAGLLTSGAVPLALTLTGAETRTSFTGTLGEGRGLADLNGALEIAAPNLAALSTLAGGPLPTLPPFRIAAQVAGQADGIALRNFLARSAGGDLTGELLLGLKDRTSLTGILRAQRVSLDAMRSAIAETPSIFTPGLPLAPPVQPAPPQSGRRRAQAELPPIARPVQGGRIIPETPWPYGLARLLDGDIRLSVGELISHEIILRDIEARLVGEAGKLTIDPLVATFPQGRLGLKLTADAAAPPARLALAARGEGLELGGLLAAFGLVPPPPVLPPPASPGAAPLPALAAPPVTTGRVELEADLRGTGDTWRGLAATLNGPLGLVLTDGQFDTGPASLLGRALGDLRRALPQLGRGATGPVLMRCGALRLLAENGQVRSQAFLLDGSLGRLGGTGGFSLAEETLALRLLLDLDLPLSSFVDGLNTIRLRAPLPISGSFSRPRADYGAIVARMALGALGGATAETPSGMLECDGAIAIARGTARQVLAPIAGPGGTAPRVLPLTPQSPVQFPRDLFVRPR